MIIWLLDKMIGFIDLLHRNKVDKHFSHMETAFLTDMKEWEKWGGLYLRTRRLTYTLLLQLSFKLLRAALVCIVIIIFYFYFL